MYFKIIIIFLLLSLFYTESKLKIEKLEGLSPIYNNEINNYVLSDKMLGILNFLKYSIHLGENKTLPKTASEATHYNYSFDYPWNTDIKQTGFSALRYNIAFASYALASTSSYFTPIYPSLVAKTLRAAIGRMVNPIVWSYWDNKGFCGSPWKYFCKIYNYSMCDITNMIGDSDCPDPVYSQNVMYSGHIAQIMALYETFSNDYSLTNQGWSYYNQQYIAKGKFASNYTLRKLMEIITKQKKESPISAYPCEPSIIYTACNQHINIASILYDSIHGTNYTKNSNQLKFYNWIQKKGIHFKKNITSLNINYTFKDSYYVGATQENLEKIMLYFPSLRKEFKKIIKGRDGLVGLDGWVNQWLEIWRPDTLNDFKLLKYGRDNLTNNRAWKKYKNINGKELWYIKDDIITTLGMFNFTISTATSFAIAGMGGLSDLSIKKNICYYFCNLRPLNPCKPPSTL